MKSFAVFLLLCLLLQPALAKAEGEIGVIKKAAGDVLVIRDGLVIKGVVGTMLFQQDLLRTGSGSSVGAVMADDTTLSLGSESELSLKEYLFNPKENGFSVVLRMVKGTFVYMSGVIGKLAPDSIRLETPDSTIAVRGTRLMIKVNN